VLSFGIPFALIPLAWLTADPAVMGADAHSRLTTFLAWLVAALITLLNATLIWLTVQ
jgi:manganese transport protein